MRERFKKLINAGIIILFIIGVLLVTLTLIINSLKEDVVITKQNLYQYTSANKMITSYSMFSSLEECVANLYEGLINEQYEDIYKLVGDTTKDYYTKTAIEKEIKRYATDVFGTDDVMAGHSIKLKKAYACGDSYLVEIVSTHSSEKVYMLINLDLYKYTYTIDLVM